MLPPSSLKTAIERTVREEWGRILASLVKTLNDFQLAEDCLQDAVVSAMHHWSKNGLPHSPAAWLITTARRKAIDRLRRDATARTKQDQLSYLLDLENEREEMDAIPDERLAMIFTCCHPALEQKTSVALTLRTLGGLTTDEIAHAFLDKPEAMAQRLVRAKKKIAKAQIPYEVPDLDVLPQRVSTVLQVIYLIFNEGYTANSGSQLTRGTLSDEAIRLARIVCGLLDDQMEAQGLLALMLLHDSRRNTRVDESGAMIALEDQNRLRWEQAKIEEGRQILRKILPKGQVGFYQVQAAISAVHAESPSWEETDWAQIVELYKLLQEIRPSPVVQLNQAIAVSHARSVGEGIAILDQAFKSGGLENYQPYHAARADLLVRNGEIEAASNAFERAIELSDNEQRRTFLVEKLQTVRQPRCTLH